MHFSFHHFLMYIKVSSSDYVIGIRVILFIRLCRKAINKNKFILMV